MSEQLDVVLVVGNPRTGSRTSQVAHVVADAVQVRVGAATVRTIELAEAISISLDTTASAPANPQPDAIDAVSIARLLIVATPSYKGTYTGLLKVFFDHLPHQALAGTAAVPVVVAGSPAHLRSTAADLTRLVIELGAGVPATVEVRESELDTDLNAAHALADAAAQVTSQHLLATFPTS